MLAIFQNFGFPELMILLVVLLLLFGAKKLPDLARSLGRSSKEFKRGLKEGVGEDESVDEPKTTTPE